MRIAILSIAALTLMACGNKKANEETVQLNSQEDRLSYALGADHGHSISESGDPNYAKYNLDKVLEGFEKGLKDDEAFDENCQQSLRSLYGQDGRDFNEKFLNEGCECLGKLSGVVFRGSWDKKGGLEKFDHKLIVAGYKAALHKADTLVKRQDQMELIRNFYESLNQQNGARLIDEASKKPNTKMVDGLVIETIEEGKGASPSKTDQVLAHYILMNSVGDTLQSSFEYEKYTGKSIEPFSLTQVIQGWTIGMPEMKEGGKYMLYVPFHLAYGQQGMFNQQRNAYDIQPYEALKFYIELRKVIVSK